MNVGVPPMAAMSLTLQATDLIPTCAGVAQSRLKWLVSTSMSVVTSR